MCGIAGFAGRREREDRTLLESMAETLRHRGPDESGFYCREGVGLGSRRLSIIDLENGTQPIANERGDQIVLNGEIYNYRSLRSELERKGHRFKTKTDTEVVVHLYEERGIDAVNELSGMFAFALWDSREEKLILARDPMGVKPLYYAVCGERLYFGSELKALRKIPELSFEIDLASLDQYLNYLYIPAPHTIYKGIHKLRPGERLVWQKGQTRTEVYWEPRIRSTVLDWDEAKERLDRLLREVVESQKVSDVPIGLFLSGGLDSSALAYYLAQQGGAPEAFCAFFSSQGGKFNEIDKARQVARHFGLTLNELCIQPQVEESLDALTEVFDEPLSDGSELPTYWISRAARQKVKVALSGTGGDEVFGGYPRYLGMRVLESYQRIPAALRKNLSRFAPLVPEQLSSRNVGSWFKRFLGSGLLPPDQAYGSWMGHLNARDKGKLYGSELLSKGMRSSHILEAFSGHEGDWLKRTMAVDFSTYLPEDILTLADRASMSSGLELRVPFCDQRLVEFALGLPSSFRVHGWTLKALFKDLLKDKLPSGIVSQKKQGFMVPLGPWFKTELRPLVERSLTTLGERRIFRKEGLRELFREHLAGRKSRTDVLWGLVFLNRWLERYHPGWRPE